MREVWGKEEGQYLKFEVYDLRLGELLPELFG